MYKSRDHLLIAWKWNASWAWRFLNDSWPLILSGTVILIYMKLDLIMLGEMRDDSEVGIYSAAVALSEPLYVIPTIISASFYPMLIKTFHESEAKFYEDLKRIMGYFFWAFLGLSGLVSVYSDRIIYYLYGAEYSDASAVLSIHVYSSVIVSMGIIFSQKYVIDGTTLISLFGAFSGAISNVLFNIWLIRIYGAKGAAIATLVSYIIPIVIQAFLFDKKIGLAYVEAVYHSIRKKRIEIS